MRGYSATTSSSVKDAKKELTEFLKTLEKVPSEIIADEADRLLKEARLEAPRDTGKLENSIKVKVSKSKRTPGLLISASARKNGVSYAGIQHDNTHFRHPVKGKAHYLSDPYHRSIKRIKKKLEKEVGFK